MEKNERVLRKRYSHNRLSGGNITPRSGRRSSHRILSKILQDESLPSMRSLRIDKSVVHHLGSMAATPANMQPRHMLSDNTDVSNITLTPRWTKYLDQTYNLRSAKRSGQKSASDNSSVPDESGNLEDVLKSPGKQRHFQHRRRNLIPKNVGTELFTDAFTRSTPQKSVISTPKPKGVDEISFEDLEEANPVVSQPFKRKRNVKTNPYVFKGAFEDSPNSVDVASNRHDKPRGMKNASASPQRSLRDRSGNRRVQESEEQSDVPSDLASSNRRQSQSTHELVGRSGQGKKVINSSTLQRSVILPSQGKGGDEIAFEGTEEASPVVSQPFKRRRNVKTSPSVFQAAFEEYITSSHTSEENVSNRLEKSRGIKNASASPQRSLRDRSGNKHVQESEEQSDVQTDSAPPNRRQPQSMHEDVGRSGQTKNVINSSTSQHSVILPSQGKGRDEIAFEGTEEASPVVSQRFKRKRNVKINPSVFEAVFEEYETSPHTSEENVSNRLEKSRGMKNASASPRRSLRDRSGNRHVQESEEQSDVQTDSAPPNRRRPQSTHEDMGRSGQTKNVINRSTSQRSVILPSQGKGGEEIAFEGTEEASPVVSQPFRRRRNVKINPSVFKAVFEEYETSRHTSEENVSNRLEKSRGMKNASASPQRSLHDRSGNRHVQESEEQSDVQTDSASPNRRQPQSMHEDVGRSGQTKNVNNSSTSQSSVILPSQGKGGDEISLEDIEEASRVVSQPFKRRRNVKTNPSVFQTVEDFMTSPHTADENVSNRLEKSRGMKNASASPQRSLRDRSGNRHVQESEEQSDVPSDSAPPNRRQPQSMHEPVGRSGQTKIVINSSTSESTVILPSQGKGGDEIAFEGTEEASPVVSQPFKRKRNVKINPYVFEAVFEEYETSPHTSEENVSKRHEKSSHLNTASSSLQRSENDKLGNEHFHEFGQQSDISSISASSDRRQAQSANVLPVLSGKRKLVTFASSTPRSSIVPQQLKGLEEVSSIVSHSFKERGNVRTNPSPFQAAVGDFVASSPKHEEDVSNRHKESAQSKNASSSPQRAQSDRSENEHVRGSEQQSSVPSNSGSPDRRQTQPTDVLPSISGQTKNAEFTSPTPQSSAILPPHWKGVGEISIENHEMVSPIVSHLFEKRRHKDSRQMRDASALANASQSNKEAGRVHTLVEQSHVPSNSSSFNKRRSEMESICMRPGVSNGTEQNKKQSTSNQSARPQNVAWFRRWQEKAAATGNARAFNLLSKEDRIAKLEEFVRDVKEKHEEAFKSKGMTKINELKELKNVQIIHPVPQRKVCKKPLRPDMLVNGKPYRPRLKRPKRWATSRLYKLIIAKCEVKYGTLKAQRKAEEFVVHLCEKVSFVIRRKKYENYAGNMEEIKKALYRLGVIKCLMDYFVFIEDYLPFEYRIKAIPCLRAYGKNTGPPMAPDADVFADLNY